ncbi:DEAD/DEAH box helicase [Lactobacillus psittaci]|uniref:ATP-dependent RNA helicase n=1 Tax=Lactobacillus psittaci DSM 15354 TaxID=1122152 RepID=A0A0R1S8P2_9LACO|nr:DEAD/DEAH box helicase [Lactobacillus psittaci]KRL63058.1 ATP-dependent RNA helicase [Lactobacillus psittaci DSM 15354]
MNNIFEDSRINPNIQAGLKAIKFVKPTKVQSEVIPAFFSGKNLLVQAATGSGKTHAYLIPALNQIDFDRDVTQVVITAPSRELAQQLYKVARQLRDASNLPISISLLSGGSDRERQIEKAESKAPQLIVATPGRLLDFSEKRILNLSEVKIFVIDEADMSLDLGFLGDIDKVAAKMPKDVQFAAFSATIPVKLDNFLRKYMQKPERIIIENPAVIAPTIQNDLLDIGSKDRKNLLYKLLTMGQPYLALVFANTKTKVDEIASYLQDQGLRVAKIHGGITERERKRTLRLVRQGDFQYVVATDLAARGIDIDGVSLVINYELPKDLEFVIHRIGRTGRNGLAGHAITLIREEEMNQVANLEHIGVKFNFVELKNGELVARTHYRRRESRNASTHALDGRLRGLVKKVKVKKKPGYKKKIRNAIAEDARQKRKLEKRHEARVEKRRRKRKRVDK